MTLTSYFDVTLNKRYAGQGSVFVYGCFHATFQCIWLSEIGFRDQMLSTDYKRTSYVFVDVNVHAKIHNFNIPLTLDKYNIMIVKLKFWQACTSVFTAECLHSSFQAKLLLQKCFGL